MAMWKAPFLKGSSFGVGERVPSGAITSEVPLRSASTAGARAALALVESVRSTYATSASQPIGANIGSVASSFLATAVKSLRSSEASTGTSSWLWWLKRKTAGRALHRLS